MIVSFRQGELRDAPELMLLLMQLGYPLSLTDLQGRLKCYLSSSSYEVFVALKENKIVGCVALSFKESFVKVGKVARIEALIVKEGFKRQGIGRLLMEKAEEKARERECQVMELTSGLRRASQGAHNFYEALNYKNKGHYAKLYLRKSLI